MEGMETPCTLHCNQGTITVSTSALVFFLQHGCSWNVFPVFDQHSGQYSSCSVYVIHYINQFSYGLVNKESRVLSSIHDQVLQDGKTFSKFHLEDSFQFVYTKRDLVLPLIRSAVCFIENVIVNIYLHKILSSMVCEVSNCYL